MTNKDIKIDFESYLMEKHSEENPQLLDDMLPDAYADWSADISVEDMIVYGNRYAISVASKMIDNYTKQLEVIKRMMN